MWLTSGHEGTHASGTLKDLVGDPPQHPSLSNRLSCNLIRFVFDPQRRIPFPHLVIVMTPRYMCDVLISIAKTAYAASYMSFHFLSNLISAITNLAFVIP